MSDLLRKTVKKTVKKAVSHPMAEEVSVQVVKEPTIKDLLNHQRLIADPKHI